MSTAELNKTVCILITPNIDIYSWPAGGSVQLCIEKLWPWSSGSGLGQHFQARGHSSLLYGTTISRQKKYLFYPGVNWPISGVCLHNFVIELAYVWSTNYITNRKNLRANKQVTHILENHEDIFKNRSISNYFMLVHQLSPPKLFFLREISCHLH